MKRNNFLVKGLIILVALILVDRGAGTILARYYHRIQSGEQGRMNFAIDRCRAETVILGSSRAEHHYVSGIIAAGLATRCYNAGKDKQRLPYCLAVLNTFYQRYTPKMIILDLNPTAFDSDENGKNELAALLPYYKTNPEIRSILDQRNRFEWIKAQSMLYCYNSLPLKILFNSVSAGPGTDSLNGYVPLTTHKEPIPALPPALPAVSPLEKDLVNCFEQIVRITTVHKTKLVVVVSPVYYRLPANLPTLTVAKHLTEQSGGLFLDLSQNELFLKNGDLHFLDLSHLNDSSARVFSTLLAGKLTGKL